MIRNVVRDVVRDVVLPIDGSLSVPTFEFEVITAGADTFQLPLEVGGTYDFRVDWGDGSSSDITVWDHADTNHSYSGAGTFIVKITGIVNGWSFNGVADGLLVFDIKSWGPLKIISSAAFFRCRRMTVSATDILDISLASTIANMFRDCNDLLNIPTINDWDYSNILDAGSFLRNALKYNQQLSMKLPICADLEDFLFGNALLDQAVMITIPSATDMEGFLEGTTLSTTNYSNTLIGFNAQAHQDNVTFHGGNATTNAGGTTARSALAADGWIITDGGNE